MLHYIFNHAYEIITVAQQFLGLSFATATREKAEPLLAKVLEVLNMTHIAGHPVIDRMLHAVTDWGKSPHHHHDTPTPQSEAKAKALGSDHVHVQTRTGKEKEWVPFKSSQTGAAVGAMTGQIVGTVAGVASAAIVSITSKNVKMGLAVGASVYLTSLGVGAISGAVGYKARSMGVDTTEPPIGSMFDTPQQAAENMRRARETPIRP